MTGVSVESPQQLPLATQFPLRRLFLIAGVAAVLFALVGPQYRSWTSAQRTQFLATWFSALPVIVGINGILAVSQRKAQALAGKLWLQLQQPPRVRRVSRGLVAAWLLTVFMSSWPSGILSWSSGSVPSSGLVLPILRGLFWGCQIGGLVQIVWTRPFAVEFRENGLLYNQLIKWSDMHACHWSVHNSNLLVVRTRRPMTMATIPVPPHLRAQVAEILQQRVPASDLGIAGASPPEP